MKVQDIWINRIGMAAIVMVSLGYVLFGSSFAQLRIEFSFLDFPIFIGEILLVFSSVLFIVKSVRQKWELGRWGWILGAYLFFVLFKAFSGYFVWGPLAFRDAALFYYPFFTVLGYSFWSNDLGGDKIRRLGLAVILIIFILHQSIAFWCCSLIIIGVILALQAKHFQERWIMIAAILIFAPYEVVFKVFYRAVFLSSLITVIFIGIVFFLLFYRDRLVRIVGLVLGCLVLGIVLFKVGQTGIWSTYDMKDVKPWVCLKPQNPPRGKYLFHPVGSSFEKPDTMKEFLQKMQQGGLRVSSKSKPSVEGKPVLKTTKPAVENNSVIEENAFTVGNKKGDAIFRFYIWRDMAFEVARDKPFFGFAFGRPLLPWSMKYYGIPSTADCDGWIGAHNSFFYMIYRAGTVGLAMVLFFLFIWAGLLRDFYRGRDWAGILLCAIILNWIISANFFLIFELPYTAIPVWTILGVTIKYMMQLKLMKE